MKQSVVKRSALLASSLLLLSTSVLDATLVIAQEAEKKEEKTSNQKKIDDSVKKFLKEEQQASNKEYAKDFYTRINEQLKKEGLISDGASKTTVDNSQRVRVMVQIDEDIALNKVDLPTGSTQSVQSIEKATDNVLKKQTSVKEKVEKIAGYKAKRSFGYLLNGFSIDVKVGDIEKIEALKGVISVTPAQVFYPTDTHANAIAEVQKVWEEKKLHGEGMVISIIDSGIDPHHKDLYLSDSKSATLTKDSVKKMDKGRYFTEKVPYGYNYADGSDDIVDVGDAGMHGQHVAGIAGANGDVKGVAPEAQLLAMKVFSNNKALKGCYTDDVIAAIEDSVKLGADVINMSLGSVSASTDPNDPQNQAIKRASDAGVISVISAGNNSVSGTNDMHNTPKNLLNTSDMSTVGSPGVTNEALTVASAENSIVTLETLRDTLGNAVFQSVPELTDGSTTIFSKVEINYDVLHQERQLIDVGIGDKSDYTEEVKSTLKGNIALIKRGDISFSQKAKLAKENGAVAAFIYNNTDGIVQMSLDDAQYPTIGLSDVDGEVLLQVAKANKKVSFILDKAEVENKMYGKMSDFSSWGPTPELNFKPEISAPGGNIYSLANGNKYQTMSGTSMSSPFVAGSQALILQAIKAKKLNLSGKELVKFAKDSAINTSVPLLDVSHTKEIISPRRQGAGQINVSSAIDNEVSVLYTPTQESTIALKEIGRSTSINVTLTNHGKEAREYTFNDYGGVYTQATDDNKEIYDTKIDKASLTTDKQTIRINAGETKTVEFKLTLPFAFSEQQFVEGFIGFDGKDTPNLVIPYMGFFGTYSQDKTIDPLIFQEGHGAPTTSGFLVSNNNTILGMVKNDQGESVVDPDAIAISPENKDNVQDYSLPYLFFNRNYAQATYDIIDEKGDTVKELYIDKNGRKDYFNSGTGKWTTHAVSQAKWSGTHYNKKTGKEEAVADGRYQYKVTVSSQNDNSDQVTYIPVTVDNTKPVIKKIDVSKNGKLLVEADDDLSGIKPDVVALNINGKNYKVGLKKIAKSNQYESIQRISSVFSQGKNHVTLGLSDFAGNMDTQSTVVEQGDADNLLLYNLSPNQTISQNTSGYNKEKETFTLSGSYKQDTTFFVDGLEVKTSDKGLFEVDVPMTKEKTQFTFTLDKEGNELLGAIPIKVDLDAPVIQVEGLSDGKINTSDSHYTLTGSIDDASEALLYNPKTDEKIPLTLNEGAFSHELALTYGDNLYFVVAADAVGNQSLQEVVIHSSNSTKIDDTMLKFDNIESSLSIINTDTPGFDKENKVLTITGKLAYPVAHFTLNGEKVNYDPQTLAFSYQMKNITTGSYRLTAYVQDDKLNEGRPVVNYGYTIWVDDTLPTLTLHNMEQTDTGALVGFTNQNPYVVKATITDNLTGYDFSINNNHVHTDPAYTTFNESFFANRPAVDVEYKVSVLPEDTSKMTATLSDLVGNKKVLDFDIEHHEALNISAPHITLSESKITNKPVMLTPQNLEEVVKQAGQFKAPSLYYSTDKVTWTVVPNDISVSDNGSYFFKYADKYGNESPLSEVKVDNIRKEVTALPTISLSSYGGKESTVTVTLRLTKEDSHTHLEYSLDEGKTWKEYDKAFDVKENTVVQVKSKDTAGNESKVFTENVLVKPTAVTTSETGTQTDDDSLSKEESVVKPKDPTKEGPKKESKEEPKEDKETQTSTELDKPTKSESKQADSEKEEPLPFENQQKTDTKENKSDAQEKETSQKSQSDEPIGFITQTSTNNTSNSSTASQVSQKTQSGLAKILPKTGELTDRKVVMFGILILSIVSVAWFTKRKKEEKNI